MSEANNLQPVILGGDIGAYSLAREFYEGYRVKSIVISGLSTGIMRHSRFVDHISFDGIDDAEAVIAKLVEIAGELQIMAGGRKVDLIVVASADWLVKVLVTNREVLEDAGFTVPYADIVPFEKLTTKGGFYAACERLNIAYPKTLTIPINVGGPASAASGLVLDDEDAPSVEEAEGRLETTALDLSGFTFPLIAKASSTSAYHEIEFAGKKKVHKVATEAELIKLLDDVAAAGYHGDFIIQDYIPGDDSGMRILTCYCDRGGKVRFSAYGEVLLEEHAPGALGNPAAIITKVNSDAVAQATRLLEESGWVGFANFDLKYDPRDNTAKFFELNPRLGRSNYYIAAAGANPIKFYVAEWIKGKYPNPITVLGGHVPLTLNGELAREHLYTVLPIHLLKKYVFNLRQRQEINRLRHRHEVSNPMRTRLETHPRRKLYVAISQLNQYRKFRRHYPRATARQSFVDGVTVG